MQSRLHPTDAATMAKYSRTVDVLNALAVAKIDSVSFTVTEEE